jgi:tetratricopeptide (TPR) repeat protein
VIQLVLMRRGGTALVCVLYSVSLSAIAQGGGKEFAGCSATQADEHKKRGESQQALDSNRAAAESFEQSLQCNPAQPLVLYRLGLAYRDMGQEHKAYVVLSKAVDGGFRNAGALFHTVEAAFASREFASALERSRELIVVAGKSSTLMMRLGRLLFTRLYYRDAVKAFELACRLDSPDRDACFYLALTRHLLNEPEAAIAILIPLAEASPGTESLALLGAAYGQQGDYESAERTFRRAATNQPPSPHVLLNWAFMMLERDQMDAAEEMLGSFQRTKIASSPKVFFRVSRNTCQNLLAELATSDNTSSNKDFAAFLENLAVQLMEKYHYAAALQLLRLAARNGAGSPDLLYAAGRSCFNLDPQSRLAIDFLQQAVRRDPGNAETWHLLGRALMWQGEHTQAVKALEQSVAIQPSPSRHNSLGKAYYMADGSSESGNRRAGAMFQRALTLEPSNSMAHYEMGRLCLRTGQFQQAITHLQQAVISEPDFYEAYYSLGLACTRMGAQEQARAYLAQFEKRRNAARQHSVLSNGYLSEGHVR